MAAVRTMRRVRTIARDVEPAVGGGGGRRQSFIGRRRTLRDLRVAAAAAATTAFLATATAHQKTR